MKLKGRYVLCDQIPWTVDHDEDQSINLCKVTTSDKEQDKRQAQIVDSAVDWLPSDHLTEIIQPYKKIGFLYLIRGA